MSFGDDSTASAPARTLEAARSSVCAIAVPPALAALSLAQAYDVQDALVAVRLRAGARQSGWKLGITSPVKQQVMGIAHPLFGRTFADGEYAGGASIAHATLIGPRAEPELAFGLKSTIDASMDETALMHAVAWIAPALEITDSRYLRGTRTAVELVADNTSSAAYAIGERADPATAGPLEGFATELVRNGTVLATGLTADVLGNPLRALAALAKHLEGRGLHAAPGDIVLSGAITDAVPVAVGDVVEARITGLGVAAVRFV
jgi:2-keto-4-pentenoate hydratase